MFRKSGPLEPLSHSLLRGVVALAAWLAIIVIAIFSCVINPLKQFTEARGLPTRSLLQDSHAMQTYGNITGFIVLDVLPISQFPSETEDWEYPQDVYAAIVGGIGVGGVMNSSTNEVIGDCKAWADGTKIDWKDGGFTNLQIEVYWNCGAIWDEIKFRTSASVPSSRPYVSISWNSTAYQTRPVLTAGLGSIHFARPNITDFESVITGRNDNPHEVEPGVTFNVTAGQNLHINVGRRRDYNVRASFLDLIGFSKTPSVYVTYPILDAANSSASIDPQITTFNFYPMFSAYNDDLYEQYLDHTVLTGLSRTGGIYSSFEVVFVLFFGRSLLAALFGKNNTNPFGRIANTIQGDKFRKRLQEAYPGIDGEDPKQRVEATCAFLHDFILDLKPLQIKPTYMTKRRPNSSGTEDVDAGSDVTGGEKDIEAAHGALHDRRAANDSEKL